MWLHGSSVVGLSTGGDISVAAVASAAGASAPAAVGLTLAAVALGVEAGSRPASDGESVDSEVPVDTDNILMSFRLTCHSSCDFSPGLGTSQAIIGS